MSTNPDVEEPAAVEQQRDRKRRKDTTSNYHCTYCKYGYKTKNGVHIHVSRLSKRCKQIHASSGMKSVWENEVADRAKKFKCEICNTRFTSSETLRVHNHRNHKQ